MDLPLARRALYELVWSRPRTQLAQALGVSDVWIGKQCRALNVPAPPRGYWAALAVGSKAKAKFVRPPLTYTVAERIQEDHDEAAEGLEGFEPRDLAQPVPSAPAFGRTLEEAVAQYAQLARAEAARRRPEGRHPVVQTLLNQDERRSAEGYWRSWLQPLYRGAPGEAVLQAIDTLAWAWTRCGFKVTASSGHEVVLAVRAGGLSSSFEVRAEPAPPSKAGEPRAPSSRRRSLEFWLDSDPESRSPKAKPARVFERMDRATVHDLTVLLISAWEQRYRDWLAWRHGRLVEARARAVRAVEEAQRIERERVEAARRAMELRRTRLLMKAIAGARRAEEIRRFVAEFGSGSSAPEAAAFAPWRAWALDQADALDMRVQPSEVTAAWLAGFELAAENARPVSNDLGPAHPTDAARTVLGADHDPSRDPAV